MAKFIGLMDVFEPHHSESNGKNTIAQYHI